MKLLLLYALLLKATLTTFSGLASLPVLRSDLVLRYGFITDRQLNTAVVVTRTTPGPVGVYIVSVGWVPVDPQKPETFGWLPNNRVRMFMDLRKSSTSEEILPLLNLVFMNGEKLQYEQSR